MTPDPRAMTDSTASLMLLDNLDDEVAVADAEAALEADAEAADSPLTGFDRSKARSDERLGLACDVEAEEEAEPGE